MLPLEGIKVLDFTHAGAGPYCTMLLGDLGADVVKVEQPMGDVFRFMLNGAVFLSYNRNKRDIVIDLKKPEGKKIVKKLIKRSDVLVESFRPSVIGKLGFSYEYVRRINPKIVYCSISGYGQTGPLSHLPAFDPLIQAFSGVMAATGEPGTPPARTAGMFIDAGAGTLAAYTITSCLLSRRKTGKGCRIDISMLDVVTSWMGWQVTNYFMSGEIPEKFGSGYRWWEPYRAFKVKDGYVFIGTVDEESWKKFCEIIGLGDLPKDPRFATNEERCKHRFELISIIEDKLKDYTREELVELLRKHDLLTAPVQTLDELLAHPHIQARKMLIDIRNPQTGEKTKTSGIPMKIFNLNLKVRRQPPKYGEHTEEILRELGYTKREIIKLKEKKIVF